MLLKTCWLLIQLILGISLLIIVLPVFAIFLFPLGIYHFLVIKAAKYFKPDLIPLTNPIDSTFIIKPSLKFLIDNESQVWKIQGRLNVSRFREHFYKIFLSTEELQLKYRNLYCYYVQWMGYCFKKSVETIVLEDQIREHELMEGESLDSFIGKWLSINDYGNNPNWQMVIIHMKKNERIEKDSISDKDQYESVLLLKIDHGLCDGYTFVHMVDKMTGNKTPYIVKQNDIDIWKKATQILTSPIRIACVGIKLATTKDVLAEPSLNKNTNRLVSFTTLNLESIKNIRRKTATHFPTILAALQFQALRKFILETGIVSTISKLPEYTWIAAPTGRPNHPVMKDGGMANHFNWGAFRIPLREIDPLKMLLKTEDEFTKGIEVETGKIPYSPFVQWIPSPIVAWFYKTITTRSPPYYGLSPMIFSNEPYKLLGHRVDHLYLPFVQTGVFPDHICTIVTVSISGQLDLSVTGHPDVFKSQEKLDLFTKVYLKEELDKLMYSSELILMDEKV